MLYNQSMTVENPYWRLRKTVERGLGGLLMDIGGQLGLHGRERFGEAVYKRGITMYMGAITTHEPIQLDPSILNPDGSLNREAFRKKLRG